MSIDDSAYEFDAPQFWDLTESIPQKQPNESWFHEQNISGPSFPEETKRRPLRTHRTIANQIQTNLQKREQQRIQQISNDFLKQFEMQEEETTAQKIARHELMLKGKRQVLSEGMLTREVNDELPDAPSPRQNETNEGYDNKENRFETQLEEEEEDVVGQEDTVSIDEHETESREEGRLTGVEFFQRLLKASQMNMKANVISIQRLLPKNIPIKNSQDNSSRSQQPTDFSAYGIKRHYSFDTDLDDNIPETMTRDIPKKLKTNTPERNSHYQPDKNVGRLRSILKSPSNERFSSYQERN
ncbi:MAG: hypothetical protein EXX96DRAFT_547783 [Benjaminiella poitrasii]|nr:MAG: hypothetical protein EXX96DRAFT_547783 [Benjaminiella poitrasii]